MVFCEKGKATDVLKECTKYLKDELGLEIKEMKCLSTDPNIPKKLLINNELYVDFLG